MLQLELIGTVMLMLDLLFLLLVDWLCTVQLLVFFDLTLYCIMSLSCSTAFRQLLSFSFLVLLLYFCGY